MNPGLAQGFLRFGTLLHDILLLLYNHGDMRQKDFVEELGRDATFGIAVSLRRLEKHGFIYACGKLHKYKANDGPTQMVWSLNPPEKILECKRASARERTRRYRAKKKTQVASVFDWRGPPKKKGNSNAASNGKPERRA